MHWSEKRVSENVMLAGRSEAAGDDSAAAARYPAATDRQRRSIAAALKHTIVDKARMLRGAPLFSEVSTEVLADLAALSAVELHPTGTTLYSAGEPADAFFLVIEGEVSGEGDNVDPFLVGAGTEVGALAVLDERPRAYTVQTTTDSLLLRIGGDDFLYLLEQHPRLARGVIRRLAREVRAGRDGRDVRRSTNGE